MNSQAKAEENKKFIQTNYIYLKTNIDTTAVCDFCFQNEVFTLDDKQVIYAEKSLLARNEKLLDLILQKGNSSSHITDVFLKALEINQQYLLSKKINGVQPTYAEALKSGRNPAVITHDSLNHLEDNTRFLESCNILSTCTRHERILNEQLEKKAANEDVIKNLIYLLHIFKYNSNACHIRTDFFKSSNLHSILLTVYNSVTLPQSAHCISSENLRLKLLSLEIIDLISVYNEHFQQKLLESNVVLTLLSDLQTEAGLLNNLMLRRSHDLMKNNIVKLQSLSLSIICNIISCDHSNTIMISPSRISNVLLSYLKSDLEEFKAASTIIMIQMKSYSQQTSVDDVEVVLNILTEWLKKYLDHNSCEIPVRPNAVVVIKALSKLAAIDKFRNKIREDNFIKSLFMSPQKLVEPGAAISYITLLSSLSIDVFQDKGCKPKSRTLTLQASNINLLIIGSSGAGKSSVGNSILDRKEFQIKDSTEKDSLECHLAASTFNGRNVKVIDTPSFVKTSSLNAFCKVMHDVFHMIKDGFHAILLVAHHCLNEYDHGCIEDLKKICGEHFMKDYCVLVLTYGDHFEKDPKNRRVSLEDWLLQQPSILQDLARECKHRVVLFNNVTSDESKKHDQLLKLFQLVDNIRLSDNNFSLEHFNRAKETRDKLIQEGMKIRIYESLSEETKLIENDFLNVVSKVKRENQRSKLLSILAKGNNLRKRLQIEKNNGEGDYSHLLERISQLIAAVEKEIVSSGKTPSICKK